MPDDDSYDIWYEKKKQLSSLLIKSKSMDWFLYDRELRHERVKITFQSKYDFRRAPEGFHCVKSVQTQPAFTCSKLTIETLEQRVKYVQS